MLFRFARACLVAMVVAAGCLAPAQAATPSGSGPNDGCMMCHGDAGAKSASGKSIAVDAAMFKASVHGAMGLACTTCHADAAVGKLPHGTVKPAQCESCHDKASAQYATSVHGAAKADGKPATASCASCHGAHDIMKSSDPASRTHHDNVAQTCATCHGNEQVIASAKLAGGNVAAHFRDSIHGQAMAKKTATAAAVPTCTGCHGTHDIRAKGDAESLVSRARSPAMCGSCHAGAKAEWEKSQHGKLRQSAVMQAPGCIDCHSAHGILRHGDPKFALGVIEQCGSCHVDFVSTYRDTFHGQVTELGYAQMASCASCHGAHQVLPASDPLSKVSAQNRLKTCQECHPKANANFAMYDPHANRHVRSEGQLLFFTGVFMDLLLLGVFSFFGLHTILWFFRSLKAVRERGRKGH